MKKTLLLFLMTIFMVVSACFVTSCSRDSGTLDYHGLTFTLLDDGTYEVSGKNYDKSDLVVPEKYNGKDVTRITEKAFANNKTIKTVKILQNVTFIGEEAFSGCTSLQKVHLSANLTSLEDKTFYGCTSLESVVTLENATGYVLLPRTLETIGNEVFYNCKSLKEIISLTDSDTPDLNSIGDKAFYGCSSLIDLYVSSGSIQSIGTEAFSGCSSVGTAEFGSVQTLGLGILKGCSSLSTLTIPHIGATKDGDTNNHFAYLFGASNYMGTGYIPASLTTVIVSDATKVADNAFYGFDKLTSVTFLSVVTSIGQNAFYNCSSLQSVSFNMTNWSVSADNVTWMELSDLSSTTVKGYLVETYVNYYWKRG